MRNIFQQLGMGQAGGKVFTANASGAHFSQAHLLAVGAGMALYVAGAATCPPNCPSHQIEQRKLYIFTVLSV
jgi:hypothetical protein